MGGFFIFILLLCEVYLIAYNYVTHLIQHLNIQLDFLKCSKLKIQLNVIGVPEEAVNSD